MPYEHDRCNKFPPGQKRGLVPLLFPSEGDQQTGPVLPGRDCVHPHKSCHSQSKNLPKYPHPSQYMDQIQSAHPRIPGLPSSLDFLHIFPSEEDPLRLQHLSVPSSVLLCLLHYKTVVGNGGVRLSGGQAKRLALARTLCHKKPVLILDDPFSALDKNTEKQIFANLKQQTKDNIVFLISHRLYLFPQMNQVIWMEDGKAVAGTHEEILEKIPEYRSLYETQSDERENAKVETENRKTVSEHTEERRSGR